MAITARSLSTTDVLIYDHDKQTIIITAKPPAPLNTLHTIPLSDIIHPQHSCELSLIQLAKLKQTTQLIEFLS